MKAFHADKQLEGIGPDDKTIEVAVLTLRDRLEVVEHFLPLAAYEAEADVEHVHQLRVWTRRAAAALKLYSEFLPRHRTAWIEKQLRRIRRVANDARDCDVQIQRLSQADPHSAANWLKHLQGERAKVQKPLVAVCEKMEAGNRFQRRVTKLIDRMRTHGKEQLGIRPPRFGEWARVSLRPIVERFFETMPADNADEKQLHQFRIQGKRLRYAMELIAPAFPRDFQEELYPIIEELQDKLGDINDLALSIARLVESQASTIEANGHRSELLKKEQNRLDEARKDFQRWWTLALEHSVRSRFEAILQKKSPINVYTSDNEAPPPTWHRTFACHPVPAPSMSAMDPIERIVAPSATTPAGVTQATSDSKASLIGKSRIVGELGEQELLLPNLVNEGLAANDRAKYLMTLLQTAREHANHSELAINNLSQERLASGIDDSSLDQVVGQSRVEAPGNYRVPGGASIHNRLVEEIRHMISPTKSVAATYTGEQPASAYGQRLEELVAEAPSFPDDQIPGDYIDRLTSVKRDGHDSLHLLVMDLHKELNRLQHHIAGDSIDGAYVYGLRDSDRPLVAAFMAGVNQTRTLKFDHPGLGTTATRAGAKLVIQNDIGTTDAHVLVIHVEGLKVILTCTDIHIERLVFFQNLFTRFATTWGDTRSRRSSGLQDELFHLCIGTFAAKDASELTEYLRFLGSRLVFLIDWNRARKRLRKFARRRVCIEVLRWAAENNIGHMGFMMLGGDQLLFDAIEFAGHSFLPVGGQLADVLGSEMVTEFLKFTLKTATEGLLAGRSQFLIRDEIGAELRRHLATVQQGFLEIAAQHASLIVELAMASRDVLEPVTRGDAKFLERTAMQAKKWEHLADELVTKCRSARIRNSLAQRTPELLEQADDAADKLEEVIYLLTLLEGEQSAALDGSLHDLADVVVQGAQEYLKCVETAGQLHRGSPREHVQDFLEAVDRTLTSEHHTDAAYRRAQACVSTFQGDFKQLHFFTEVARNLEESVDALLHSAFILRNYILSDVLLR
jgi:CHAD domain-containing protein/uncharacterized protein Yka (UPF0111/DUF47 family)